MRIIPLILAVGLAAGGSGMSIAPTTLDDGSVSIIAAPTASGRWQSDQPLRILGQVSNSTSQTLEASTVTVYLSADPISTRSTLVKWVDNSEGSVGTALGTALGSVSVSEVAAGQNRSFSITIPVSQLQFMQGNSGVFRLTARLTAGSIGLASFRSVVTAMVSTRSPKTNLVVVAPIVAPPSSTGLIAAEDLALLTAPGGSLDRQLTVAFAHNVSIGVDPMIVASIRILGTSAPETSTVWLNRLESSSGDVFALPYADTDLRLLRLAGATSPLQPLTFPIDETLFPPAPDVTPGEGGSGASTGNGAPSAESLLALNTTIDGLAWPLNEDVGEADLDFDALAGYTKTLVSSANISSPQSLSPNAKVGSHDIMISDAAASSYLRAASTSIDLAEWVRWVANLTGLLAVSERETPGATIIATLGRDGSVSGPQLNSTLNSVEALPWISPGSLTNAMTLPASPLSTLESTADVTRDRIAAAIVESATATQDFSDVANDPTLITGPSRLSVLALLSQSWSEDPSGWKDASNQFLENEKKLRTSVQVPESSQINLLQEKGYLYIAVRNELDFPVTVFVTVQPERGILDVLDDRVKLTIEADSQAKATVPVQSIANGEVRTMVSLSSTKGERISTPTFINLNVQAGWETAATVVLAIIVVLLFGAGIWRTVLRTRKGRKQRSLAATQTEDAP